MSRIRNCCATLLVALLPFLSAPAGAVVNAIDPVPGVTVLYPYFEVNLADTNGATTLMSLVNTSATAILGRVTVWSDWGTPVLAFSIYLTGYDVSSWNMRDILNGLIPQSASAGQDPSDTISHKGTFSQDINFASCTGTLPPANLSAGVIADVRAALTGTAVSSLPGITSGMCVGRAYGDQVARGYVTVDTVNNCTARTPAFGNVYFTSDTTNFQNVLWGDYMQINPGANTAYGDLANMIESPGFSATPFASGNYTFYGRFNTFDGSDNREALGSNWIVQGETGGTSIVAWRDSKTTTGIGGVACGTTPGNQPLANRYADAAWFDSNAASLTAGAFGTPLSKVPVSSGAPLNVPTAKKLGFIELGLGHTVAGVPTVANQSVAQSVVITVRQPKGLGRLTTGTMAFPVNQVETNSNGMCSILPFGC